MRNSVRWAIRSPLVWLLALSGCAAVTPAPAVVSCPQLPPVPVPLMQPPPKPLQTASRLRSLLFEPVTPPTGAKPTLMRK